MTPFLGGGKIIQKFIRHEELGTSSERLNVAGAGQVIEKYV